MLGKLVAAGSAASFVAYGLIVVVWTQLGASYQLIYLLGGLTTAAVAVWCWFAFPQFVAPVPQRKTMVVRRRYWLYYLLQVLASRPTSCSRP
jgi:hypothetical protein